MYSLLVIFLALVIYTAQLISHQMMLEWQESHRKVQSALNRLVVEKKQLEAEKKRIKHHTEQIFTLYDLTKAITKNFNAREAFEIFKSKLTENVPCEDCQFLDPGSSEIDVLKASPEYFLFFLQDKTHQLGVLAIKGLKEADREKVAILGHQFALASRRIKLYHAVEQLAIRDSLTGLYTHRYLMERLEEELKRAQNRCTDLTFLMIDADHFKHFNDQYGHLAGDQILKEIGSIIQQNIREIDFAGRYGGEEFCVVLPETNIERATFVAERIRSVTEKNPIKAYDAIVNVTISLGLAGYPQHGKLPLELVEKADLALYKAKLSGRNKICVFNQA